MFLDFGGVGVFRENPHTTPHRKTLNLTLSLYVDSLIGLMRGEKGEFTL